MNRSLLIVLLSAALLAQVSAAPKSEPAVPKSPSTEPAASQDQTHPLIKFQGEDLAIILQKLAEMAGTKAEIESGINGPFTIQSNDKTPRELIAKLAEMEFLQVDELDGVHHIKRIKHVKDLKPEPSSEAKFANELGGALLDQLVPAMTKLFDAILDYEARPETVAKIAKSKKALLDSFIGTGFTREEAFQLLLAEPGLSFFGTRR